VFFIGISPALFNGTKDCQSSHSGGFNGAGVVIKAIT
jgi:hypothetical protein